MQLKEASKMIENIKARFKAKKYNILTEQIDTKRKADSWRSSSLIKI